MKKIIIIFSIAAVSLFIVFLITQTDQNEPETPTVITKKEVVPEIEQKDLKRRSRYYIKPEVNPLQFAGFHDMKQGERLRLITRLMEDKKLSRETIEFFKAEIFNRGHRDIIRNNMANAICWQKNPEPDLHLLFIKMLEDPDETPKWRDYCLQFLTECYESSNDKLLIIETFKKYSTGKDSKAGTALIHLALNKQEIDSQQTLAQLEDPKTSIHTRTAILAVWGKTGETGQLPKIREYATQDKNAALKANAIGALGLIGDSKDLKIINLALYHNNGRVVLAARAAKSRIEKRMDSSK